MKATMEQVAERAGVSKALVSRYLNGKPGVGGDSAAKIQEAIDHYRYRLPSVIEGRNITMLIDGTSLFHKELLKACAETALEEGYAFTTLECFYDYGIKERSAGILSQGCVNGVIVYGSAPEDRGAIDILLQYDTPLILIENDLPGLNVEKILVDNYHGQYTITKNLIDMGYHDIRMIPWNVSTRAGTERLAGFLAALRESPLTPGNNYIYPPEKPGFQGVFEIIQRLQSSGSLPQVFVCSGDTLASYAAMACMKLGIRVPEDLCITGFDGASANDFESWGGQITTMKQPLHEMGVSAVKRLVQRIQDPERLPETTVFQTEFVRGVTVRDLG